MATPSKLLVVSSVVHYRHRGRFWAYGPYAREMDVWADLFPQVEIAAPCREAIPLPDCVPFSRDNITLRPQPDTGGDRWRDKAWQIVQLPRLILSLSRALVAADAVHVRCPSNLGLLGVVLAPLFTRLRVAKYAGQWGGDGPLRFVNRLQRALLRSRWWGAPVTVYGEWPGEPSHVHSFFTSMMTAEQIRWAAQVASKKRILCGSDWPAAKGGRPESSCTGEQVGTSPSTPIASKTPLRILYCGRLTPFKRIEELIRAVRLVMRRGLSVHLAILGDGPDRDRLAGIAAELEILEQVEFVGGLPFDEVMSWYEWAHCLVLPSASEGWPKVLAEAMCHGVVCIAVSCGHVPRLLDQRGVLLERGTAEEIAAALQSVADQPAAHFQIAAEAALWAQQFSLEGLGQALRELLSREWAISLGQPVPCPEARAEQTRSEEAVLKSI